MNAVVVAAFVLGSLLAWCVVLAVRRHLQKPVSSVTITSTQPIQQWDKIKMNGQTYLVHGVTETTVTLRSLPWWKRFFSR